MIHFWLMTCRPSPSTINHAATEAERSKWPLSMLSSMLLDAMQLANIWSRNVMLDTQPPPKVRAPLSRSVAACSHHKLSSVRQPMMHVLDDYLCGYIRVMHRCVYDEMIHHTRPLYNEHRVMRRCWSRGNDYASNEILCPLIYILTFHQYTLIITSSHTCFERALSVFYNIGLFISLLHFHWPLYNKQMPKMWPGKRNIYRNDENS